MLQKALQIRVISWKKLGKHWVLLTVILVQSGVESICVDFCMLLYCPDNNVKAFYKWIDYITVSSGGIYWSAMVLFCNLCVGTVIRKCLEVVLDFVVVLQVGEDSLLLLCGVFLLLRCLSSGKGNYLNFSYWDLRPTSRVG